MKFVMSTIINSVVFKRILTQYPGIYNDILNDIEQLRKDDKTVLPEVIDAFIDAVKVDKNE